ncbi:ATP-binding protein [Bdellovibrionales bacterium]|nr:ATP-binding protein [Bdellovibrionales bacterium]
MRKVGSTFFCFLRDTGKSIVRDLYKLKWLEQGRAVIIVGPTGVGKTFLAQALSHHACHHKHSTVFMSISTFLENLMLARSSNTYLKFRAKMTRPSLLVLDDFGLKKFSDIEAHDLNDIIKERLGAKSIIITTQLPMDHWSEVIEDPVIADTIIDQLSHSALKIILNGESYRKVKAGKLDSKNE